MSFRQTKFWQNYNKFDKIVGNSSMRCTTDAIIYWKLFCHFNFRKILEIGVYQGLTSGLMLESSDATLVGVDPKLRLDVFNSVFDEYHNRTTFINNTSQDFETTESFDFILIDGDHNVDVACHDLMKFAPLLTKSGVLAVDDYDVVMVPKTILKLRKLGLVPLIQAQQTEFWHYPDQNRENFLNGLLTDKISKFILLFNMDLYGCTTLKAKTVEAFTDNMDLFDRALEIYNV
jgi:predicted O-methyltransferase YrrM